MSFSPRVVASLCLGAFAAASAQETPVATESIAGEPDILDAAPARAARLALPEVFSVDGVNVVYPNGMSIPYGDPDLETAAQALRDDVPRPWTLSVILPLFEAAVASYIATLRRLEEEDDDEIYEVLEYYEDELIPHLSVILAASGDARAALALVRVFERGDIPWDFAGMLLRYYAREPGYDAIPQRLSATRGSTYDVVVNPPSDVNRARQWIELNRAEVELRAAALPIPENPSAAATVAGLVARFKAQRSAQVD